MKKIATILCLFSILLSCGKKEITFPTSTTTGISENEILIGSSSPLTGPANFLGTQLVQGSQSYFNKINENGGINGRKIKMITLDDKYNPPSAIENSIKLIKEDKVFILFDYVGTPTAKVVINTLNIEKIPLIGVFTGAEFLRNPLQPYIINIRASYFMETEAIVDYWIKSGKKRIAVFMQDDAFGQAVLSGTQLALARHKLEPLGIGKFKRGEMPDQKEVDLLSGLKPDAIIMVGTYKPLAKFVKMAKSSGLADIEFHTVSFVGSEAFAKELTTLGNNVDANVFVTQVVPSPYDIKNELSNEFNNLYMQYYPKESPNYVAFEGFINAKFLVKAIERCGKDISREKLLHIFRKMHDYNAGTGLPSVISPDSNSIFEKVYISKIENGKFTVLH